jgi:hypothetical protein
VHTVVTGELSNSVNRAQVAYSSRYAELSIHDMRRAVWLFVRLVVLKPLAAVAVTFDGDSGTVKSVVNDGRGTLGATASVAASRHATPARARTKSVGRSWSWYMVRFLVR